MKSRKHLSKVVVRVEEPGPNRNASTVCRAALLVLVLFVGLAVPSRGTPRYELFAPVVASTRPSRPPLRRQKLVTPSAFWTPFTPSRRLQLIGV
jgi:hypothetical protein